KARPDTASPMMPDGSPRSIGSRPIPRSARPSAPMVAVAWWSGIPSRSRHRGSRRSYARPPASGCSVSAPMTAQRAEAKRIQACRSCGSPDLATFLSLGEMPLANAFRRPGATDEEARYPLELTRCERCGLVQLTVIVPPDILFRDYAYASSASRPMIAHFDELADLIVRELDASDRLVVEIGSN